MSYRTLTVNGTEYKYTIGKNHTKVVGLGVFKNSVLGNPVIGTSIWLVSPKNVRALILGKPVPTQTCIEHQVTTAEVVANPYDLELYDERNYMINCPRCVESREWDI